MLRRLSFHFHVTDSLIIPLVLIFLSCHEKALVNKAFSGEISKPCRKSQITIHEVEP